MVVKYMSNMDAAKKALDMFRAEFPEWGNIEITIESNSFSSLDFPATVRFYIEDSEDLAIIRESIISTFLGAYFAFKSMK